MHLPGLVTVFNTPLLILPFTLHGNLVIDPALHEAHIDGLTVSSRLGRIRRSHRKLYSYKKDVRSGDTI